MADLVTAVVTTDIRLLKPRLNGSPGPAVHPDEAQSIVDDLKSKAA